MKFTDEEKLNNIRKILGPEESKSFIKINSNVDVYASLLEENKEVTHQFRNANGYLHLVQQPGASIILNEDKILNGGDGAFIKDVKRLQIRGVGKNIAEFILFDLE